MMKVLFIVSGNHGAVSPVVKNQGDALAEAGVDVEYYLIKGKGIPGYLRNIYPLKQYIRNHSFDAVHAHYSMTAFAATLAGVRPLVVSLMGSDVKATKWYKFLIKLFAALGGWKTIIVKSSDMYNSLGIKRAIVIPNGVNLKRFEPMDKETCQKQLGWGDGKHILFPANPARQEKDFALAEKAVGKFSAECLILHAFENVPNEQTPIWYNAADVVLMTSKWEGSPNAIKEAMACDRPIVTTNVGDVVERLQSLEGCYIAKTREPEELAELLKQAMIYGRTQGRERIMQDGLANELVAERIVEIYLHV